MLSEIIYIVIEDPIKALINTDTLEVYTELPEEHRFFNPSVIKHQGIEFVAINEVIEKLERGCFLPDCGECPEPSIYLIKMLKDLRKNILDMVSM